MRRLVPVLISVALLAGCGGGGGRSTPAPGTLPAAGTPTGATVTAIPAGPPVATATLAVKFSSGFQTAKLSSASKGTTAASSARGPAYVNSNSKYLDVYVVYPDLTIYHVVSTFGTGSNVQCCNSGTTQNFSIPLYSAAGGYIVAFEADTNNSVTGSLLALGEADFSSFTPGTAPQISMTMIMNAAHIGVMSDPDNANGDATAGTLFSRNVPTCMLTPMDSSGPLYFFVTDPDGGFIDNAGTGGVVLPTVSGWTSDTYAPSNSLAQGSGVAGTYYAAFAIYGADIGVTVNLIAPNPAYAVVQGALVGSTYPGVYYLYNSYADTVFHNYILGLYNTKYPTISNTIDIYPDTTGCTQTFGYTGGQQTYAVPSTATKVTVIAQGAEGSGNGGPGGQVIATIPVVASSTLYVYAGGQSSFNGGGASGGDGCNSPGGDASDVRQGGFTLANRVVVAGGGGGGGCDNGFGGGAGGAGGGLVGSSGANVNVTGGGFGGGGGTQFVGGLPGNLGTGPGNAMAGLVGALGFGGNGGAGDTIACGTGIGGSGGGGGYYGGGGGGGGAQNLACAPGFGGGGGGGGSSYTEPSATNVFLTPGVWYGYGTVTIQY